MSASDAQSRMPTPLPSRNSILVVDDTVSDWDELCYLEDEFCDFADERTETDDTFMNMQTLRDSLTSWSPESSTAFLTQEQQQSAASLPPYNDSIECSFETLEYGVHNGDIRNEIDLETQSNDSKSLLWALLNETADYHLNFSAA